MQKSKMGNRIVEIDEIAAAALEALDEEPPVHEMVAATCRTLARHVLAQEAPGAEAAVVIEADHLARLTLTTARYGAILKELDADDPASRATLENYLDGIIARKAERGKILK